MKIKSCLVLSLASLLLIAACSATQDKEQAKGAAIFAGCKYGLEAVRDAGEAGAVNAVETGCEAELKAWRSK